MTEWMLSLTIGQWDFSVGNTWNVLMHAVLLHDFYFSLRTVALRT